MKNGNKPNIIAQPIANPPKAPIRHVKAAALNVFNVIKIKPSAIRKPAD